jgi:hypothetical protein
MKTGGRPMLGEGACARILQIISLCKTQSQRQHPPSLQQAALKE